LWPLSDSPVGGREREKRRKEKRKNKDEKKKYHIWGN